jgi:hypothetical protein
VAAAKAAIENNRRQKLLQQAKIDRALAGESQAQAEIAAAMGTVQELEARTLLLQSQLDYTQANDEIIHAMGRTPE